MHLSLAHLKSLGFYPKTVVDIGVAHGTKEIYTVFPNSFHLLIEPIVEFNESIKRNYNKINYKIINKCVSSEDGSLSIHVRENLTTSSLHKGSSRVEIREVEVNTLDQILLEQNYDHPILVKIDVEGHELNVLAGAVQTIPNVDVFVLEATFNPVLENSARFEDVYPFLIDNNFRLFDLINIRNDDKQFISQADLVYVSDKLYDKMLKNSKN